MNPYLRRVLAHAQCRTDFSQALAIEETQHHRVAILRELGHAEARCDVWEVDDHEAKLLLATLNRLAGQDVPIRRAELIHELLGEMSAEDLAGLLPETDKQLEELHALLEFPADEVSRFLDEQAAEAEKVLPRVMSFVVTPQQEELIEAAVEAASDGTPGRDRKARGLANLARHFLKETQSEEEHDALPHEARSAH